MSALYLLRHGQAGTRNDYDVLSETGYRQARSLGAYFAVEKVCFEKIFSGELKRQSESALTVIAAMRDAGVEVPDATVDARWNEFDLDEVYKHIGPLLAGDDAEFARAYREMMGRWDDPESRFHRGHSPSDFAVVRAWIENTYSYGGESWEAFNRRITEALTDLQPYQSGGPIAIFTSATPTAIAVGHALGLDSARVLRMVGLVYNASISSLRLHGGVMTLFSFNSVPHLPKASDRTFR